jgi:hypothetical protein
MPLPKDPDKVKEWKRNISFGMMKSKRTYEVELSMPTIKINKIKTDIKDMTDEQLILAHSKIHVINNEQTKLKEDDIKNLHGSIIDEYEKRNLRHVPIDKLDDNNEKK